MVGGELLRGVVVDSAVLVGTAARQMGLRTLRCVVNVDSVHTTFVTGMLTRRLWRS
jgi:hypothetical protein